MCRLFSFIATLILAPDFRLIGAGKPDLMYPLICQGRIIEEFLHLMVKTKSIHVMLGSKYQIGDDWRIPFQSTDDLMGVASIFVLI